MKEAACLNRGKTLNGKGGTIAVSHWAGGKKTSKDVLQSEMPLTWDVSENGKCHLCGVNVNHRAG